jgi:Secretion system C-terminal sorting domain
MKVFVYVPAILILFAVSTTARSQSLKTVCVIGSSTAYGYFPLPSPAYPQDSGWVCKVKKYYQQYGIIDTFFNLACLGRDCYSGMPSSYIPPAGESNPDPNTNITKAISMVPRPDVIIINYPSNDYDRISNAAIVQCFQTMKDSANANGIRCYIATSQPRNSFDSADRQKLKDLKDTMMSVFGTWAIDFFTPIAEDPSLDVLPEYDLGDNIHINPAGHTELAKQVINKNIFTTVLPVKMEYFIASPEHSKTILKWATSFEEGNSSFKIERSTDGRKFTAISFMNATGNTEAVTKYQYTDESTNSSGFFYRIDAVAVNGADNLSPVVYVAPVNKTFSVSAVYPSPSANIINTQIAAAGKQKIDILVTDALGKQMLHQAIRVNNVLQYRLDISKFSTGTYFIRFGNKGQSESLSFFKQ